MWNSVVEGKSHLLLRVTKLLIFFSLSAVYLGGCDIINPPEEKPAYITFKDPLVLVDSVNQVYSSLGIKDAWVFQGGKLTGVYPIPSTIPYINISTNDFFIEGGVYESGISSFRLPYPFWRDYHFNGPTVAGDTIVIQPVFEYFSDEVIQFSFEEDFETSVKFTQAGVEANPVVMNPTTVDVFAGSKSGIVTFDSLGQAWNVRSLDQIQKVGNDNDIWAEITYKSDVEFTCGLWRPLQSTFIGVSEVIFTPKTEWTTTYVHLAKMMRESIQTPIYLWFRASSDDTTGTFQLDNVRVINFDEI